MTIPTRRPWASTTGSAVRSYLRKTSTAFFLSSVALEADELVVHQVRDVGVQRGQQDLADPQVVDQLVRASSTT